MLKKDLLELCLLQLLSQGDKYGYEVLTPLRAAFPDTQESAIYALLRGLGKSGLTSWYMAPGGGGPDRKYYRLTPEGRARLEEARAQAEAQVRDLLKEAEERAAKHTEQVLEQTRSSCGALRAEAQKKLDQAAQSIVRRVVNS